jgi:hypothetical protein
MSVIEWGEKSENNQSMHHAISTAETLTYAL